MENVIENTGQSSHDQDQAVIDLVVCLKREDERTKLLNARQTAPLSQNEAFAQLISHLRNDAPYVTLKDSSEALTKANRELLDGDTQAIREALARQVILLEAVTFRFLADSNKPAPQNIRQALANVGLNAQKSLVMSLLALHRVNRDQNEDKIITI
jgi:hypothetical protein